MGFEGFVYCLLLSFQPGGSSCVPERLSISIQVYPVFSENMIHPYKSHVT